MKNEIDLVLIELIIFIYPEYFIPKFNIEKNKEKGFDQKKLHDYHMMINGINWFVKKISRYQLFFNEFYPDTNKISKHEALEHHIHAYLEDLETLRNKLVRFINQIKKDSKITFQNKNEIETHFKSIETKIFNAFSNVADNRNPHRHGVYRFTDKYVTDGEMASAILGVDFTALKHKLTQYGLEKLQQQEKESFENGKKYWSQNALKNFIQVKSLTNEIMKHNKKLLFKLIGIKPFNIKRIEK